MVDSFANQVAFLLQAALCVPDPREVNDCAAAAAVVHGPGRAWFRARWDAEVAAARVPAEHKAAFWRALA